jgi:hypothetical protein
MNTPSTPHDLKPLTTSEKVARAEIMRMTRGAAQLGVSLEQYRRLHEAKVERWCELAHQEMQRAGVDDPLEVLPVLLAKLEEIAVAKARKAAEAAAKNAVALMLRKAIA